MADTPFKKLNDVQIYVTDEGKFTARIGRTDVTRKDLKDLEREIIKRSVRFKAIRTGVYEVATIVEVATFENNKVRLADGDLIENYSLYVYTDDAWAKAQEIVERQRAEEARRRAFDKALKEERFAWEQTLTRLALEHLRVGDAEPIED